MYLLVYLAQGHLPWLNCLGSNSLALQTSMVKEQKVKLKGEELCKDLPSMNIMNIISHRTLRDAVQLQ